jgi:L-ascorbate metabolism protein UlaG (beta-lactamase superfamily)
MPDRVRWLGHSTVLIELDGVVALTDPLLRKQVLHLRRSAPLDAEEAAEADVVLLSHLHYDHLDLPSLARLGHSVQLVVPSGASGLLHKRGFRRVVEVDAGEELHIGSVAIRATHAEHRGSRRPFGASASTVGYLVSGSLRVYFAGDTDLFDGMSALSPGLDLALLPVAGWGRRVPRGHLDPHRAAEALRLLRPRVAVPIHWGTYRPIGASRSAELMRAPAESFARVARELAPEVDVHVLEAGGTLELEPKAAPRPARDAEVL